MRIDRLLRTSLAVALSLIAGSRAASGTPVSPAICEAAMQRAAATHANCLAGATALAHLANASLTPSACDARLTRALAAIAEWGIPCPDGPDAALYGAGFRQCLTAVEDSVAGTCRSRMTRAAGRYLRCRQLVAASESEGLESGTDAAQLCSARLDRALDRFEESGICTASEASSTLRARLDACLEPLAPQLITLEGTVTVLAAFPDGQPRQVGIAVPRSADSFWVVDGLENVYFAESSLARELGRYIGETVRVRGEVRVGLEFLRTIFPYAYEREGRWRIAAASPRREPGTSVDGVVTVLNRYSNGHPRSLGVVDADNVTTRLLESNKSQELLFRIGRRMRVFGVVQADGSLRTTAYQELGGSPRVGSGDGFRMSFLAGGRDENGVFMGGVEVDALIAFDGRIFAGTSYRKNTQFETTDPEPPGAQVLVLDRPDGRWRVDFTLPAEEAGNAPRMVYFTIARFETDAQGNTLDPPVERLAAVSGNGEIYLRKPGAAAEWTGTGLRAVVQAAAGSTEDPDARSVVSHRDSETGASLLLAGTGVGRRGAGGGIYRGTYDPSVPGEIRRSPSEELAIPDNRPKPRVMGLVEAYGRVYASVGTQLLERLDGPEPTWREIYRDTLEHGADSLRRATPIRNPDGGPGLLIGIEGFDGRVVRVDLESGQEAEQLFGRDVTTGVFHALLACDGPAVRTLEDGSELAIMGLHLLRPRRGAIEPETPDLGRHYDYTEGLLLLRDERGAYSVNRILDETMEVHPPLIGTRAILPNSPFPGEEDVLYFGGFDHDGHLFHNTGWIFKAHLDDVRRDALPH